MKEESDFKNVTIIGCGLIGGSIGLALKKNDRSLTVFGVDRAEFLAKALHSGAIDQGSEYIEEGVKGADIVILATPIKEIINLLTKLKLWLPANCLLTDTGSTKMAIMAMAEQIFSDKFDFIGGHPLAGLEKGGIANASADLFVGKPYLVIPKKGNSSSAHKKMSSLISRVGAVELKMDASEHDCVVALVSHLPQLIAVIMSNMLGLLVKKNNNEQYFKISGNVFQEMTRVATSPFNIWKDIYQTNGKFTIDFIVELEDWLDKIKEKIAHNPAALEEDFERAKYFKEQMLKMTG